ncbi:MAG: CHASE domain-containing protein [Burkholderiales bacterium]
MNERQGIGNSIASSLRDHRMAWGVLLVSLVITAGVWWGALHHAKHADQEHAQRYASEMRFKIEERMHARERVLTGASALFEGDASVRRERWRKYSARLDLPARVPGTLGFVEVISRRQKDEVTNRMHEQKLRDFSIYPAGKREVYAPVLLLEPGDGANAKVPGFDMWTEPSLQAAMKGAADTRAAVLSAPVTLTQDSNPVAMLFLPVYWETDIGPSVWRPLGMLRGWVFSPVFAVDLVRAAENSGDRGAQIEIRDNAEAQGGSLLLTRDQPSSSAKASDFAQASVSLQMFGRTWDLTARLSRDSSAWIWAHLLGVTSLVASWVLFVLMLRSSRTNLRLMASAKDFEQRLQVKTDALNIVHDHAPVAIVEISSDSKTVRLNKRCEELVELTHDQAQDWGWSRRIHPDDRQAVAQAFQSALIRGTQFVSEHRIHKDDDWVKWVRIKMVPIREQDRVSRFIGVVEDVSEAKEATKALEEALEQAAHAEVAGKEIEERLAVIFDSLSASLVITNEEGIIQSANAAACRLFGFEQEELPGQDLCTLISERSREPWLRGFQNTSVPLPRLTGLRGGGQEFPVEIVVSQMMFGEARMFLCVLRDATDIAAAEAELKKLHVRVRELEANPPVAPVAQVATRAQPNPEFLAGKIDEVGQRLMSSLGELLNISKLSAGVTTFGVHEINALVRGTMDELSAVAARRGVHAAVEYSSFPVYAWCNPERIRQVLRILLSNAFKFTPAGKPIAVRVAQSWLPEGRRAQDMGIVEAAEVSVTDEGAGIPEGELERIFQQREGSALHAPGAAEPGLAACSEILREHDGHINASHNPAGGSVFTFVVPCRQRHPQDEKAIPATTERIT